MELSSSKRHSGIRILRIVLSLAAIVALLGGAGMGLLQRMETGQWLYLGYWIGGGLMAAGILAAMAGLLHMLLGVTEQIKETNLLLQVLRNVLRTQEGALNQIGENILLSEAAKTIAFREKDRDALRHAIREDMDKQEWEQVKLLIEQMRHRFGYRDEADSLEKELITRQQDGYDIEVQNACLEIEKLMDEFHFLDAGKKIKEYLGQFPKSPRIAALPDEMEKRRQRRKRQLLAAWDEAVHRNEVDRSIDLLKELDHFLTPNEAEGLRESVKGVFKAKLRNLGVQFSIAVSENAWQDALRTGQELMDEFPNSRMGQEVRERLDILKQRAEGTESSQSSNTD